MLRLQYGQVGETNKNTRRSAGRHVESTAEESTWMVGPASEGPMLPDGQYDQATPTAIPNSKRWRAGSRNFGSWSMLRELFRGAVYLVESNRRVVLSHEEAPGVCILCVAVVVGEGEPSRMHVLQTLPCVIEVEC